MNEPAPRGDTALDWLHDQGKRRPDQVASELDVEETLLAVRAARRNGPDHVAGLVRAAADGDARAWEELVGCFSPLVWSVCQAQRVSDEDIADIFQMTWLRLLENLDRIRDPQRLPTWIAATCQRECLILLEQSHSLPRADEGRPDIVIGEATQADGPALTADQWANVWLVLSRLPERRQEAVRALSFNAEGEQPSRYLLLRHLRELLRAAEGI
jgi:RNA polymerase sigma factor (sigma-70 family)